MDSKETRPSEGVVRSVSIWGVSLYPLTELGDYEIPTFVVLEFLLAPPQFIVDSSRPDTIPPV